ncbi:glycosyltransferase family 4 protein [Roseateles sp. P5_E7]
MHIALAGHIAGEDVRAYLSAGGPPVPSGYFGAPLTGILIGELLKAGHRVTGITTDATLPLDGGPVRCEGPNFTFIVCPARRRAWRPNGWRLGRAVDLFAFERRQIRRAIVEATPDLVHVHWSYEFALAALAQPAPHLITCHDSPRAVLHFTRSFYRALRYLMAQRVFRRGREFTTVSDYMARELSPALGYPPEVIPNPVAGYVIEQGRPRSARPTRRVAMICNGWDRRKNPEPALQAFHQWRQTEPAAELHLYGAGFGPGEEAQRWTEQHGLSAGMTFHGKIAHRKLVAALGELDALLHPSLEESFGVVLAEAMALGLPVVAGSDSGAVPWVMGADADGHCAAGVLVDVRLPAAITSALATLFDEGYAARSMAGLDRVRQNFSAASVIARYEARYSRVLAAPAALEGASRPPRPSAEGL